MKNILIIGSSRSGTSLTVSLFRKSGYFLGNNLLPPSVSNPRGYYEDKEVNSLNNQIINRIVTWPTLNRLRKRLSLIVNSDVRAYPMAAPLWIKKMPLDKGVIEKIKHFTNSTPFCYKDPRFNVTLPLWMPFLPEETRFICVFRDPYRTADSQLRNAREVYSPRIPITLKECNLSWYRNYKRILNNYSDKKWLFVNYDMILSREAITALENFTEAKMDVSVIDRSLSRSKQKESASKFYNFKLKLLFRRLQQRATSDIENWSFRNTN